MREILKELHFNIFKIQLGRQIPAFSRASSLIREDAYHARDIQ